MLFAANSQQWFNTDCIETIDDFGSYLKVTLKGGRDFHVHDKDMFFACIADMRTLPPEATPIVEKIVFGDHRSPQ